jgi:hypothetical protein
MKAMKMITTKTRQNSHQGHTPSSTQCDQVIDSVTPLLCFFHPSSQPLPLPPTTSGSVSVNALAVSQGSGAKILNMEIKSRKCHISNIRHEPKRVNGILTHAHAHTRICLIFSSSTAAHASHYRLEMARDACTSLITLIVERASPSPQIHPNKSGKREAPSPEQKSSTLPPGSNT